MPTFLLSWKLVGDIASKLWKGFLNNWKPIVLAIVIVGGFFLIRHKIRTAIENHDNAIVKSVEERKDKEWQEKLDKAQLKMQKEFENVRKNQKALEAKKPRNQRDTIDLLRRHRLNSPD